jgi:lipopolysaccharide transport system ATP-binding protein
MYVRLAFAVAAHLEPEILLVDEVLAVGDAAFQKKCLRKMGDISGQGRTVVLVSHNMASIQALCQRVLLLQNGQLVLFDDPQVAIRKYLDRQLAVGDGTVDLSSHPNRITPSATATFQNIRLLNQEGKETSAFTMGEKIIFEITLDSQGSVFNTPFINLAIERSGVPVCNLLTHYMIKDPFVVAGRMIMRCYWEPGYLAPGIYLVSKLSIKNCRGGDRLDTIEDVLPFEITPTDVYGTGKVSPDGTVLVPKGKWEFMTLAPSRNRLSTSL